MDNLDLYSAICGEPVGVYNENMLYKRKYPRLGMIRDGEELVLFVKSQQGDLLEVDQLDGKLYRTGNTVTVEDGVVRYNIA